WPRRPARSSLRPPGRFGPSSERHAYARVTWASPPSYVARLRSRLCLAGAGDLAYVLAEAARRAGRRHATPPASRPIGRPLRVVARPFERITCEKPRYKLCLPPDVIPSTGSPTPDPGDTAHVSTPHCRREVSTKLRVRDVDPREGGLDGF